MTDIAPDIEAAGATMLKKVWRETPALRARCQENFITFLVFAEATLRATAPLGKEGGR